MFVLRCWLLVVGCIEMKTNNEEEQERRTTREEAERARREHIYTKKNNKHKGSPCHTNKENVRTTWRIIHNKKEEKKKRKQDQEKEEERGEINQWNTEEDDNNQEAFLDVSDICWNSGIHMLILGGSWNNLCSQKCFNNSGTNILESHTKFVNEPQKEQYRILDAFNVFVQSTNLARTS